METFFSACHILATFGPYLSPVRYRTMHSGLLELTCEPERRREGAEELHGKELDSSMVICRKVGSQELTESEGRNGRLPGGRRPGRRRPGHTSDFQGGPVFLPPRSPSPFAQALLAKSVEGDSVSPPGSPQGDSVSPPGSRQGDSVSPPGSRQGDSVSPPGSPQGDSVTSYDELWFLGRPRAS